MNRDSTFDVARSVAIVIIVNCHFFLFRGCDGMGQIGGYLGGVGNFIFFAISAVLFGLRYEQKGASAFEAKPFMKKRLVRLFASLWPFLIAILTIYSFIGVEYNVVKAVMNFVGLGWFGKLPNIGHLWFVTMIIFCYTMYVCVAKTQIINRLNRGGYLWIILLLISILLHVAVDYIGQPGYLFMVLFYSLWFFGNASRFMAFVERMKVSWLWMLFIACNSVALATCYHGDYPFAISIQRFACYLSGLSWLMVLLRYGKYVKPYGWLMFLSGTSYEIYLVHHAMCCGALSVIHATDYRIVNYIILWVCSCSMGWLLKLVGNRINGLMMR